MRAVLGETASGVATLAVDGSGAVGSGGPAAGTATGVTTGSAACDVVVIAALCASVSALAAGADASSNDWLSGVSISKGLPALRTAFAAQARATDIALGDVAS